MLHYRSELPSMTHKFTSRGPSSFSQKGNPQGYDVFNEAESVYPEAIIKASFPKILSIHGRNS
jgi:hypothetical protein